MILIKSLNGDLFTIDYNIENPPTISFIREHLRKMIDYPRNEMIRLFSNDNELKDQDEDEIKDDTELMMMIDFEKQMKSNECKKVEMHIKKYLGTDSFYLLKTLIKDTCSLIAGGSIICSYCGLGINDLDIYVHYSKSKFFIETLGTMGFFFDTFKWNLRGPYDQSFFYKNKILSRFRMILRRRVERKKMPKIDIMIIPDDHPLEHVVTNFDLSFCEMWWDGTHLYASDPYGVRNKEGILKPDYREAFFSDLNPFIFKRIQKYKNREFKIDLGRELVLEPVKKEKNIVNGEEWAIGHFLKQISMMLMYVCRYQKIHIIYHTLYPQEMTYQELVKKWGNEELIQKCSAFVYSQFSLFIEQKYRDFYKNTFSGVDGQDKKVYTIEEIREMVTKFFNI